MRVVISKVFGIFAEDLVGWGGMEVFGGGWVLKFVFDYVVD